jgi:hypothetical protein
MVTRLLFKRHIRWSIVGLEKWVGKVGIGTRERIFWLNLQLGSYFNTVRNKFPFCFCHTLTQNHILQSAYILSCQLSSHVNRTLSGKKKKFVMLLHILTVPTHMLLQRRQSTDLLSQFHNRRMQQCCPKKKKKEKHDQYRILQFQLLSCNSRATSPKQ